MLDGERRSAYLLLITHECCKLSVTHKTISFVGCCQKPLEDAIEVWTGFKRLDELLEVVEIQISTILTIRLLE